MKLKLKLCNTNIGLATATSYALITLVASAAVAQGDSSLENITAVISAGPLCGYTINKTVLETAITVEIGGPEKMMPGGEYYPEIQSWTRRIVSITATEAGRSSFCASVKSNLSAFFD